MRIAFDELKVLAAHHHDVSALSRQKFRFFFKKKTNFWEFDNLHDRDYECSKCKHRRHHLTSVKSNHTNQTNRLLFVLPSLRDVLRTTNGQCPSDVALQSNRKVKSSKEQTVYNRNNNRYRRMFRSASTQQTPSQKYNRVLSEKKNLSFLFCFLSSTINIKAPWIINNIC